MAEFKFGFEEVWFRLIIKKIPDHPDLFLPASVEKAQDILRIGKLKVGAARAWAEAAGIICKQKGKFLLTPLGRLIARHDEYLEEDGIWWVIHYNLARQGSDAWFYSFYLNEFTPDTFHRDDFEQAIREHWDASHEKSMTDSVYKKLVYPPFKQLLLGTEDSKGTRLGSKFGLLTEAEEKDTFTRASFTAVPVPKAVFCFALLDWSLQEKRTSVHLEKLLEPGGVGRIFRLERETLDSLLVTAGEEYQKEVCWISHTAGLNSVSIMQLPPLALVSAYYHELDGKDPLAALACGKEDMEMMQ